MTLNSTARVDGRGVVWGGVGAGTFLYHCMFIIFTLQCVSHVRVRVVWWRGRRMHTKRNHSYTRIPSFLYVSRVPFVSV